MPGCEERRAAQAGRDLETFKAMKLCCVHRPASWHREPSAARQDPGVSPKDHSQIAWTKSHRPLTVRDLTAYPKQAKSKRK